MITALPSLAYIAGACSCIAEGQWRLGTLIAAGVSALVSAVASAVYSEDIQTGLITMLLIASFAALLYIASGYIMTGSLIPPISPDLRVL